MAVVRMCQAQQAPAGRVEGVNIEEFEVFLTVTVNDPADCGGVVCDYVRANGFGYGQTYAQPNYGSATAVVKNVSAERRQGSQTIWDCIVSYGLPNTKQSGETPDGELSDDPLEWRYQISFGSIARTVPAWIGRNMGTKFPRDPSPTWDHYIRPVGTWGPFVNSAGTPLDPPPNKQLYDGVLRITGNLAAFDTSLFLPYLGHVNTPYMRWHPVLTSYYGFLADEVFKPSEVLMTNGGASYRRANGVDYWAYSYEFRFRPRQEDPVEWYRGYPPGDGWFQDILDQGFDRVYGNGAPTGEQDQGQEQYTVVPGSAPKRTVADVKGKRSTEPVLLDGRGSPLTDLDSEDFKNGVWFRWQVYPEADFRGAFAFPIFVEDPDNPGP